MLKLDNTIDWDDEGFKIEKKGKVYVNFSLIESVKVFAEEATHSWEVQLNMSSGAEILTVVHTEADLVQMISEITENCK